MKKLLIMFTAILCGVTSYAQGVNFFKGTLDEALKKAKEEGKMLFVDCYAEWCGPCKKMAAEVFTNTEVAAYADAKFISYKLNTEAPEHKNFVLKYKIRSLPTLLFLSPQEKVIDTNVGAMRVSDFMRQMKIVCGDALSFTQLYEKIGKDEDVDGTITREFLLNAPNDIRKITKEESAKWKARVMSTYTSYIKAKPMEQLLNMEDFIIITTFNDQVSKNNPVFKFICDNYTKYKELFDGNIFPVRYIITCHSNLITTLAKKADLDYLKELERINGDLKGVYSELGINSDFDLYTVRKHSADAAYIIYGKKDVSKYIELVDNYFQQIGDAVSAADYETAAVDMFSAFEGKLPVAGVTQCSLWLTRALEYQLSEQKQMQYLVMLGDCYNMAENTSKARESYNKAYIFAMQLKDQRAQAMIKMNLQKLGS